MKILTIVVFFGSFIFVCCNSKMATQSAQTSSEKQQTKGLKDYYKDYFFMGVAVTPRELKSGEANLVTRHFSSMTPENAMKMGPIHPEENRYYWNDADSIVAFAQRNKLKVRG